MDTVNVACVCNAGHVPHLATMLRSLAASNPRGNVVVHLLHDDSLTAEVKEQLATLADGSGVRLHLLEPTEALLAALPPPTSYYPVLVWFRIMLPELLPDLDRVLYVDVDTLVMQDLRPLWSMDLASALLGAVAAPKDPTHLEAAARIELGPDRDYFNSGVLLMNLRQMRSEDTAGTIFAIGREQARQWSGSMHFRLPDQDALNLACADRWLPLHPKWNCLGTFFMSPDFDGARGRLPFAEAVASPGIVHFEGPAIAKPWNYRCRHPLRHLYMAYRRETPWPLMRLEDAGLTSRLLRPLPLRVQLWLPKVKQAAVRLRARRPRA